MKYGVIGGAAALGALSGVVYPTGWQRWVTFGRKPWEIAPGVVDYEVVKEESWGPSELGFANDIRSSPPEARVLSVAQWYDYWPGSVLQMFSSYMRNVWNVGGVRISWLSNIYTANEELFTWVTQTGRKFDLMFPTNYTVESLEKAGQLVNLKKEWIPNYVNTFGRVPSQFPEVKPGVPFEPDRTGDPGYYYTLPGPDGVLGTSDDEKVDTQPTYPAYPNGYNNAAGVDFRDSQLNGYAYRGNLETYDKQKPHPLDLAWGEQDGLLAVPYQWGTTGIGYRKDIFRRQDIEQLGWEIFERPTYTNPEWYNPETGQIEPHTFDLTRKKMLLDDMRETFTAGLKEVGWKRQMDFLNSGLTTAAPTAIPKNPGPTFTPDGTTPASPATYAERPFVVLDPKTGRLIPDFQWSTNETGDAYLQGASDWLTSLPNLWGFNTPQQGPFLVGGTMWVDQAWSGDIMYAVRPASSNPPPVDYFVPRQGGPRWIDNATIHRESERLWLSHEFINFLCDPIIGAIVSNWNFYASPNAWSFELLFRDKQYTYELETSPGNTYVWNPAADHRIYSDIALGVNGDWRQGSYLDRGLAPILSRCEYQKDIGVKQTLKYFSYWRQVKF